MYIILSQRKDTELIYYDDLYRTYHFPARYKNQISPGDIFIYYQGDRYKREHRVYFGTGVVSKVYSQDNCNFYAELCKCKSFQHEVPIYLENNKYIEQLGYDTVRKSPIPPWQSSIRPLSEEAYKYIVSKAGLQTDVYTLKNVDELKADLKSAIKGFFVGNDKNCLDTIISISQEIKEIYQVNDK